MVTKYHCHLRGPASKVLVTNVIAVKELESTRVFLKAVWDWDMKRMSALPKKSRHSTLKKFTS